MRAAAWASVTVKLREVPSLMQDEGLKQTLGTSLSPASTSCPA